MSWNYAARQGSRLGMLLIHNNESNCFIRDARAIFRITSMFSCNLTSCRSA